MKRARERALAGFIWSLIVGACFLAFFSSTGNAQGVDLGWPRTLLSNGVRMEIYQPQVDVWEKGKLEARAAVAVTERASGQSFYGSVQLVGKTVLDQEKRLVTLYDVEAKNAMFPSAGSQESAYATKLSQALRQWTMTISLDRLLADLAITQNEAKTTDDNFSSAPPRIFLRQNPAVLILIDGQPVMQNIRDTKLMRVLNSPAMIVLDPDSNQYFLRGDSYWMAAPSVTGPWSKAVNPPAVLNSALAADYEPSPVVAAADQNAGMLPELGQLHSYHGERPRKRLSL